ncbi:cytochrome P450 [Dendrothele bispora CBS 962.96]|uniref:Cytochrome P450 n=1 Tax=Dendrothele bispora (strain CBS 962.96) TaxID=1314807 RepID=A0A4S8LZX7_DENBC|nr:cytochrome P450 [Dendrothele bispora CBS 962.96]
MSLIPTTLLIALAFIVVSFLFSKALRPRSNIPRVGPPGPFGYIYTVFRSILDSDGLVEEGWNRFDGKPFVLPSATGEWIVLGRPEDVELLRRSDDSVFNAPMRAKQLFKPDIMFGDITSNPYHLETIIRSDLTKALKSLVPEMLEEAQLVIPEKIGILDSSESSKDSVTVPLFETMISIVARVSNRAMIGAPGCRNEKFLKRQVSVAEQAIPMGQVLGWFPGGWRKAVWKVFSIVAGSKDEAVKLLTPYVVERIKYAQQDNPQVITDLLLRYAPEEDINQPEKLTVRVVHLNMASIHTSSIFTTHCLFQLARMSPDQIDAIRTEIVDAIQSPEGGRGVCNKNAVDKFYMLDSILKEVGRYQSLFAVGSSRFVLHDTLLSDGTTLIPAGSVVSLAPKPLHKNPKSYADPEVFDPFRFSKLRTRNQQPQEEGSSGMKNSFTALSNDYIVFGIGKHACPGRFFAALKVKVILAEILLNYDLSFPEGTSKYPKPFAFNIFTVPSPFAKLTFTKRKGSFKGLSHSA